MACHNCGLFLKKNMHKIFSLKLINDYLPFNAIYDPLENKN